MTRTNDSGSSRTRGRGASLEVTTDLPLTEAHAEREGGLHPATHPSFLSSLLSKKCTQLRVTDHREAEIKSVTPREQMKSPRTKPDIFRDRQKTRSLRTRPKWTDVRGRRKGQG